MHDERDNCARPWLLLFSVKPRLFSQIRRWCLSFPSSMAQRSKKKGKACAPAESWPVLEPALERSTVINQEGLAKIRPTLAADSNERKATTAWPASRAMIDMEATEIPIHLHALLAGLIPPFSDFFNAIISHYQIDALHLDPQSIILLAVFAFLCEAMVGIAPSLPCFAISSRFTWSTPASARGAWPFRP